ncbi:hypothetical protein [Nonomuraea rubra]
MAAYAGQRPFVWFDDQVWAEDEEYLRVHQVWPTSCSSTWIPGRD